jgi:protease-4
MGTPVRRTLGRLALFLLLLAATPARGEEVAGSPWEPYRLGTAAGPTADPFPLLGGTLNPAAAGLVQGAQLSLGWGLAAQGGSVAASLLGPLTAAIGFDHLSPLDGVDGWRTNLLLGLDFGPAFQAGFSWQRTFGDDALDGRDPLSAGLLVRPSRWFSCSLTAFNLSEEAFDEERFGLGTNVVRFGAGVAVRPGTDRLRLAVDVDIDRRADRIESAAWLGGVPVRGLELSVGSRLRMQGDALGWGVGATVSLSTAFTDFLGGYTWVDGLHDGFGAVRFTTVSEPTHIAPGHYFVKMDLPVAFPETSAPTLFAPPPPTLLDFRRMLRTIAEDPAVDGILLTVRQMQTGWAQAQEIAASLQELKKAKKKVVVYLLGGANQATYLASHADHVIINPAASLFLTGISGGLTFYGELLRTVGIEAQFVRIGKYKSFPEKYERTEPTEAYREAHTAMLDQFFAQLVDGIAGAKGVPADRVREWIDAGPFGARQALEAGLVDRIAPRTDLEGLLHELGYTNARLTGSYPLRETRATEWGTPARFGVLTVQGSMVDGKGFSIPLLGTRFVGSDTIIRAIQQMQADPRLHGVLVRIDSPGGSALAAERMNRALLELAKRKPLVVSVGNVAASGGLYLAVASPEIFVSTGSVTGSIGIWFGKIVASGLLDKLQVHRTDFRRGRNAGLLDLDRRLTEEELGAMASRLQEMYDLFLDRVGEGRELSREEVEKSAQGRVWTGSDALERKLADTEGGCLEALDSLRHRARIDADQPVEIVYYPQPTLQELLSRTFTGAGAATTAQESLEGLFQFIAELGPTHLWAVDPWLPAP